MAETPPPAIIAPALEQQACAGEVVSRVLIYRHPPSPRNAADRALTATTEAVGLERPRTEESVLMAYLRLRPGQRCTERDRRESERMLRAQPYVSSAAVTALPDGEGRVAIRVDVVSEIPWVVGGRFGDGKLQAVRLGTLDYMGRGLKVVGSAENGGAYRAGVGVSLAQYGVAGRPAVASLILERRPLGRLLHVAFSEPFITDGQITAIHGSARREDEYALLVRPEGVDAAVRTERATYHAGAVRRIAMFDSDRLVGLAGVMFTGTDTRSGSSVVIASDSGIIQTGDTLLAGRYPDYGVSRLGVLLGMRALQFDTVRRFDALRAAQDVGSGVQVNLFLAPSIARATRSNDLLIAGDIYAGMGNDRSFASLGVRAEARTSLSGEERWDGTVASARLTWHTLTSAERTRVVSLTAAAIDRLPFPAQLTLRDPDGGLIGYPESHSAGGRRVVLRVEERKLTEWLRPNADVAIAAFVEAGRLWAGDVPYGTTSMLRSAAGFSLLGAFPSGGKQVVRIDVGFPLNPEPGGGVLALRFTITDRTNLTWLEPRDVMRARGGPGPAALMRW